MAQQFVRTGGNKQLCEIQITQDGSPPRIIKDSTYITDPDHLLKKNVGERGSYKHKKENQPRKHYSLRSKAKEKKRVSHREFNNIKLVKQKFNLNNGNK